LFELFEYDPEKDEVIWLGDQKDEVHAMSLLDELESFDPGVFKDIYEEDIEEQRTGAAVEPESGRTEPPKDYAGSSEGEQKQAPTLIESLEGKPEDTNGSETGEKAEPTE
jgi:hypothetical protein